MRIAYLNPSGELGGAEVALLNILSSLREAQPLWELHLIASDDGVLIERARNLGVSTTILKLPESIARLGDASAGGPAGEGIDKLEVLRRMFHASPEIATYALRLRQVLRELNPDIVHTNGFKMHVLGALARARESTLVWHIHDYVSARPIMARAMKLFAGRCSLALTNSNSVSADLQGVCGSKLRVQTVYNGVDTTVFSPHGARLDLDALSGLPHSNGFTVRVGMLATLARWKGHKTFLRAFSYLPPDLHLRGYLIGGALYQTDGSQYSLAELKTLANQLGIADRFGFTGFVDKPAPAMRALDIVVHGSTEPEPFGMVIAEGMASGRPIIVSRAGGAMELIDENVNALSHTAGDAISLAQRIEELVRNANLRSRLGAAGRATAKQRFDCARLARDLAPLYCELRGTRKYVRARSEEQTRTREEPGFDSKAASILALHSDL